MPGSCRIPVLQHTRWIALPVAGRIAETIEKISLRAGSFGNAGLGITGNKRPVVVNDVKLALHGIDDEMARSRVVIMRIAMQPVALHRLARHIDVHGYSIDAIYHRL